ncbi:DUF2637 domain-containing protein [Rhodococcus sp. NPDC127528]|uniref:DUF2637 domain-containing protein n=1 Tax=unclassified Rhodococcus (in: high G+C Gram-positive bacteria) TaxID=192944 RepID=UPI003630A32F
MTRFAAACTYVIAVLAFALSYSNLAALAARAGYGTEMAHVWPLAVDGLAVVATAAVMRLRSSRLYAWLLLVASTVVSIVAGAAAHLLPAGPLPGWAGAAVAVVPPLCLLVAPHLAVQLHRDAAAAPVEVEVEDQGDAADVTRPDAPNGGAPKPVAVTHVVKLDAPAPDCTPDAALFDLVRDAPARRTRRRGSVTAEQRAKVLRLAATTPMSGRDIADAAGTSEASVRRILGAAGGRDALQHHGAPELATAATG